MKAKTFLMGRYWCHTYRYRVDDDRLIRVRLDNDRVVPDDAPLVIETWTDTELVLHDPAGARTAYRRSDD